MTRRRPLSRRAFLGGAGAMIALPFLEAMTPTRAALAQGAGNPAKRILAYYIPNGIHMAGWTPEATGNNYAMTPILEPLSALRDKIMVLTGLSNEPAHPDGPGDHAAGTGSFLTATHVNKTQGSDIRNGISMDQVAAPVLGESSRFPSLQLGIDGGGSIGNCDSGYSCAYARNISWAGPQTPLPKTVNPRVLFDRLFAGADEALTQEERDKRRRYKRSILDYAVRDARSLSSRLGLGDRHKVDEYLTGIRELERRLEDIENGPICETPNEPPPSLELNEHIHLMSDLMVTAMQCDLTRVITFMLSNAGSSRSYPFLGVHETHHEVSHHQGIQANLDMLQTIDIWEVEKLAYLLSRMDNVEEANGQTLLDNSALFFSSEIEDGNAHRHRNLPIVLAGSLGGHFTSGRHIRYTNQEPVANLFISMLQGAGVPANTFGDDGTGPLHSLI